MLVLAPIVSGYHPQIARNKNKPDKDKEVVRIEILMRMTSMYNDSKPARQSRCSLVEMHVYGVCFEMSPHEMLRCMVCVLGIDV